MNANFTLPTVPRHDISFYISTYSSGLAHMVVTGGNIVMINALPHYIQVGL